MWTTETFHPNSKGTEMDRTIKILNQTIVSNVLAKVNSVHTLPSHVAEMHVLAGNAEYVAEKATNRAVGAVDSDSKAKTRAKKK